MLPPWTYRALFGSAIARECRVGCREQAQREQRQLDFLTRKPGCCTLFLLHFVDEERVAVAQDATQTEISQEVAKRRTFAIISHPDAGKTTLTEKLLLYSGAVDLAGAVRTRKNQRHATSDWMAIEQERGISITSSVLQFEYGNCWFNLLDTPGHQDFSEDTYRTLMAVDSAVMVLDAAKGIEPQTRKLFDVCRMRRIPILTFINKLDHPSQHPLELLDEIEKVLKIEAVAMNWPIGDGADFQGVYDIAEARVLRFERTRHGQFRAPVNVRDIDDPQLVELLGEEACARLREEVELISIAGKGFDLESFLNGDATPVYFGSALNNFGVQPFLDALVSLSPPPGARKAGEQIVNPDDPDFSGFIFKIQANMNPKHRDSVAFIRICSGTFTKDMSVDHPRLGRKIRLSRPYQLFAKERTTVAEAYPGDVIGLSNPGLFAIGDTVYTGRPVRFPPMPTFDPELFALLRNTDTSKYKQFHKGIDQLEREGAIQRFTRIDDLQLHPILGAVGQLQFDVVKTRLELEYGVDAIIEPLPYTIARRVDADEAIWQSMRWPSETLLVRDRNGDRVALFATQWQAQRCAENNPNARLTPLGHAVEV